MKPENLPSGGIWGWGEDQDAKDQHYFNMFGPREYIARKRRIDAAMKAMFSPPPKKKGGARGASKRAKNRAERKRKQKAAKKR